MKHYTNEEILSKCQAIWDAEHEKNYCMGWESKGCIEILRNDNEEVKIKLACMYETPSLNLDVMMRLADLFGTKNINDDDKFGERGCDTCDYGSSYGFTLTVRPESN